jgi:hypothetical protein
VRERGRRIGGDLGVDAARPAERAHPMMERGARVAELGLEIGASVEQRGGAFGVCEGQVHP